MTLSTGSSAARAASCPRRGLPRPVQQQHDPPPRLPPAPARRRSLLRRRPIHRRHPSHPFRANGWTACRYLKLLGKCCKLLAQTSRGRRVATYLEVHAAAGKCPHHPELSPPQAVTISYSETSKAPRGGGKLNGFHNLTASLRSAEGASLRSAGARFARLGLASLAWGAHKLQYSTSRTGTTRVYSK